LDDLQWADSLSLALINYLARKYRNSRLLIIGAYRIEEVVPTTEGSLHPLQETMFSMNRDGLSTMIELDRLTRNDLPELLTSIFHSSIGEEFVEKLYIETEGNPLFTLETLNMLVVEGFLAEKEGLWILSAPIEDIGIPSKVHDVIQRRLSRLNREERRLLDLAAVCGRTFHISMLRETLSLDLTDILQQLIEIEQRHRLIRSVDSTFEFTHQQIRDTIYDNMNRELRRIYHLKTATYLEKIIVKEISDSNLVDVTNHYVNGGASEKAFDYLIKLAEKAISLYANRQAIDYLTKALEATKKNPSLATNENLYKIYMMRGRTWNRIEYYPKPHTRNDFNLMHQLATTIGDESKIAEAHLSSSTTYNPDNINERKNKLLHLNKALELARKTDNKPLEARVFYTKGHIFLERFDTQHEGLRFLEEAIEISRETGNNRLESAITRSFGSYYDSKGEYTRAKEYLNRAIALIDEKEDLWGQLHSLMFLIATFGYLGEYNDAISTAHRSLQLIRKYGLSMGVFDFESMILNVLGWIYYHLQNFELAIQYNNKSIEFAPETDACHSGVISYSLSNLGLIYLSKNDYESAEKYFKEAWKKKKDLGKEMEREQQITPRLLLGDGEISLAKSDHTQALQKAEEALAISENASRKKYIAKSLKLKSETLTKMGKLNEAIEHMSKALNLAKQLGTPHLLWQINYSYGHLLDKCRRHREAEEQYAIAINLIETTASRLNDQTLAKTLLNAPMTKAIRDSYTKIKLTSQFN
jgi:tetratricopeptide (TPR) repeat protein